MPPYPVPQGSAREILWQRASRAEQDPPTASVSAPIHAKEALCRLSRAEPSALLCLCAAAKPPQRLLVGSVLDQDLVVRVLGLD